MTNSFIEPAIYPTGEGVPYAVVTVTVRVGDTVITREFPRVAKPEWEIELDPLRGSSPRARFTIEPHRDPITGTFETIYQGYGNPRDEYHTMEELYNYRMIYHAHAIRGWLKDGLEVVKSGRHSDGEECFGGGWFIVTAQLPTGQVSNHYEEKYWSLFQCPSVHSAPEWDGHNPEIAYNRMYNYMTSDALQYTNGR